MKKFIVCLLSFIITFVCCGLTSCKNGTSSSEEIDNTETVEKVSYQGTHDFSYTETDDYLVKDGKTEYILVYSTAKDPTKMLGVARSEFIKFFRMATGITLATRSDEGLIYDENAKYISLGETTLSKSAGIVPDKELLGSDGVRIETKGKSIFLYGGAASGTLYAVYDFLELEFNYEFYYTDCYEIDTDVKEVTLKNYNVTDIPDIPLRSPEYGWQFFTTVGVTEDEQMDHYRYRQPWRFNEIALPIHEEYTLNSTGKHVHNTSEYFPKRIYQAEHPKWFGTDGVQPCFTARGDDAELEAMVDEAAKKIEFSLQAYPVAKNASNNAVTFTIEDGSYHCTCEACVERTNQYGGFESALVILFMNRVAEKVDAWMALEENAAHRRDLTYLFYGYNYWNKAPVYYDEVEKKYKLIAEELELRDNVGVYLCVQADRNNSIYTNYNIDKVVNHFQQWSAICDNVYVWSYSTNFNSFLSPSDTFAFQNEDFYQLLAASGCKWHYNNSQYNQYGAATTFHMLKAYINSKLMWNSSLKSTDLMEKYFEAMFKESADVMYKYFEELRVHWKQMRKENVITNNFDKSLWPYGLLDKWQNMFDEAVAKVEKYKETDATLYNTILKHIDCERLFLDYGMLEMYADVLTRDQTTIIKKRAKHTIEQYGINNTNEHAKNDLFVYVKDF